MRWVRSGRVLTLSSSIEKHETCVHSCVPWWDEWEKSLSRRLHCLLVLYLHIDMWWVKSGQVSTLNLPTEKVWHTHESMDNTILLHTCLRPCFSSLVCGQQSPVHSWNVSVCTLHTEADFVSEDCTACSIPGIMHCQWQKHSWTSMNRWAE